MKKLSSLLLMFVLLFTLGACNDTVKEDDNNDVATCPEGQELNDEGACEDIFVPATECPEGQILFSGYCVDDPNPRKPPSGEVPDDGEPTCRGAGYTYDIDALVYDLVWSDEFDGSELDLTKWRYEVNGDGGGNNELQYYTDQNTVVEDGLLKIIAKHEDYEGMAFTSSRITTQNAQTWKYGVFEIRAKLPGGVGSWPAIWMMPENSVYGTWPKSGEMDIMENVGKDPYVVHSSIHTNAFNHKENTQKGWHITLNDPVNEFNVYKLEWLPDRLIYSVNDEIIYTYIPTMFKTCPTKDQWPFDKNFFLIMNVAVGGDWGGTPHTTAFPVAMEVDYVRVYQSTEITELKPEE